MPEPYHQASLWHNLSGKRAWAIGAAVVLLLCLVYFFWPGPTPDLAIVSRDPRLKVHDAKLFRSTQLNYCYPPWRAMIYRVEMALDRHAHQIAGLFRRFLPRPQVIVGTSLAGGVHGLVVVYDAPAGTDFDIVDETGASVRMNSNRHAELELFFVRPLTNRLYYLCPFGTSNRWAEVRVRQQR